MAETQELDERAAAGFIKKGADAGNLGYSVSNVFEPGVSFGGTAAECGGNLCKLGNPGPHYPKGTDISNYWKAGTTKPGRGWQADSQNPGAVFIDVDTSDGHFVDTPVYFASLGGYEGHEMVMGAAAIYKPQNTGFRVYIASPMGKKIDLVDAEAGRWQVNWIGFKTDDYTKECNKIPHVPRFGFGTSVLWSEEEHDHSKFIKNDIMTTDAGFTVMPMYLVSLTGDQDMYKLQGATAIYDASIDHFDVQLIPSDGGSVSVLDTSKYHYMVNWMGLGQVHLSDFRQGFADDWKANKEHARQGTKDGVHVDVTFYKPFSKAPLVFTTIQGSADGHQFATVGPQSPCNVTRHGFTVYAQFTSSFRMSKVTPESAKEWKWTIEWLAVANKY